MVVTEKENTELRILEAARHIFQQKGFDGARMQEIADTAHINKGLLHYYFKSKDALFHRVFGIAFDAMVKRIAEVLNADRPLMDKIEAFCGTYIGMMARNAYLPRFVIHEISRNPDRFIHRLRKHHQLPDLHPFFAQVEAEAAAGRIRPTDPRQLLVNMMSMSIFPFLAQPMIQVIHGMGNQDFEQFVAARRTEVAQFIIHAIQLEKMPAQLLSSLNEKTTAHA
jgi:TetR/AcrR family transcriptional regulator